MSSCRSTRAKRSSGGRASGPRALQTDLAEDPRYAERRAEMEALLLAEMERLDDPYRLWDQR